MTDITNTTDSASTITKTYSFDSTNKFVFSINSDDAVAELISKKSKIKISLYKKLNLLERLCYYVLGFKYKIL